MPYHSLLPASSYIILGSRASFKSLEYKIIHSILVQECTYQSNGDRKPCLKLQYSPFWLLIARCLTLSRQVTLVTTSPLALSFTSIFLARLLGVNVTAFVWDVYPSTIGGFRSSRTFIRILIDAIEPVALRLCSVVYVPSRDFLDSPYLANARPEPFWLSPKDTIDTLDDSPTKPFNLNVPSLGSHYIKDGPQSTYNLPNTSTKLLSAYDKCSYPSSKFRAVQIVFAGQINISRDLLSSFRRLLSTACFHFELHVCSSNPLPSSMSRIKNIIYHGYIPPSLLPKLFCQCDAGLISVNTRLDVPAFPSKTFDYLAAGLPCLYCGPPFHHYVSALSECEVGIDITKSDKLELSQIQRLSLNLPQKREHFYKQFCLCVD